ncbi:hypothetical protein FBY54_1844, partial [Zymomonas mobilis]
MTASSSSSHFVASSPMSPSLNADLSSSDSASSATLSDASVLSSEPVSVSFEQMTPTTSPFIDRLGRFKRGTYRIMLIETGMPYDSAKIMADQAAEQHKIDRIFSKSMPLANSVAPEIPAS